MTAKKLKSVEVEKSDYKIYLKKMNDFYSAMIAADKSGNWTAVGLNAVHCAISGCDAILTFHLGIRSAGEDHMQAGELLLRIPREGTDGEASAFKRIIAKKNLIAYENREFRQTESREILKLTERFYNWIVSSLPKT